MTCKYKDLRTKSHISYDPISGYWIVTKYEHVKQIMRDEEHFSARVPERDPDHPVAARATVEDSPNGIQRPLLFYPNIDMSIPSSVYNESYDAMWELLRWEAYEEAQREPLLTSFLWSTILNHRSMETSLAFLLANRLVHLS